MKCMLFCNQQYSWVWGLHYLPMPAWIYQCKLYSSLDIRAWPSFWLFLSLNFFYFWITTVHIFQIYLKPRCTLLFTAKINRKHFPDSVYFEQWFSLKNDNFKAINVEYFRIFFLRPRFRRMASSLPVLVLRFQVNFVLFIFSRLVSDRRFLGGHWEVQLFRFQYILNKCNQAIFLPMK